MNIAKLFQYITENLDTRLKTPYVSQDYSEDAKQALYAGINIALHQAKNELTIDQIIDVFNAMKPEKRANMKFPTRRASVAFLTSNSNVSEQGLLELLEWAEKNQVGYGPRFELINDYGVDHFKTVEEMRDLYNCLTNEDMAKKLFKKLTNKGYKLRYIPPFDSINPFIDSVVLTEEQSVSLLRMESVVAQYEIFNAVQPKLENLIAEFNLIKRPSLIDIARFIKSTVLLHPFPDGNGRVFILGILNQLLLKNKLGICLNLDPRIVLLSSGEIAQAIETNLIKLEELVHKAQLDTTTRYPQLLNWLQQLKKANSTNHPLLTELEKMNQLLNTATKDQALAKIERLCAKIITMDSKNEINYSKEMPRAELILEKLHDPVGQQVFLESHDISEKKVFDLLTLSQAYIVHLEEELLSAAAVDPNYSESLESILCANPEQFNDQPLIKLTLQKYQAVNHILDFVEQKETPTDKLITFKKEFAANKTLLETRRDSAIITFLKGVLTVLTLSAAYFWGIWDTKGEKLGNQIEEIAKPEYGVKSNPIMV